MSTMDERQSLLRHRIAEAGIRRSSGNTTFGDVVSMNIPEGTPAPLTPPQRQMWFHQRVAEESTAYTFCVVLTPNGAIDWEKFVSACELVVARHPILRTLYRADSHGRPYQTVDAVLKPRIDSIALEPQHGYSLEVAIDVAADRCRGEPFDLASDCCFRVYLLTRHGTPVAAVITIPHIAADGGTFPLILDDLADAYNNGTLADSPRITYIDYSSWLTTLLGSEEQPSDWTSSAREFWTTTLAGLPAEIALPIDHHRPDKPSYSGAQHRRRLGAGLDRALTDYCRSAGVSPFVAMEVAVAVTLRRHGAGDAVALGSPVDLRNSSSLRDVVGFFTNTVIMRVDMTGGESFNELVANTQAANITALDYRYIPFDDVVRSLAVERHSGRNPIFQVMVSLTSRWEDLTLGETTVTVSEPTQNQARFDLTFLMHDHRDGGPRSVSVLYACDLFDSDTAGALLDDVVATLGMLSMHPDIPIDDTPRWPDSADTQFSNSQSDLLSLLADDGQVSGRIIGLRPQVPDWRLALSLYRLQAAHRALRMVRDGEYDGWRVLAPALCFESPLSGPVLELRRTSELSLEIIANGCLIDDESWLVILDGFADVRATGRDRTTRDAREDSWHSYLIEILDILTSDLLVTKTEQWIDLLESSSSADPVSHNPTGENTKAERAIPLTTPSDGIPTSINVASAVRAAALTAVATVLGSDSQTAVFLDEPDRQPATEGVIGRLRIKYPVLLPAGITQVHSVVAALPARPDALTYQIASEYYGETAGVFDEIVSFVARLRITITDQGDRAQLSRDQQADSHPHTNDYFGRPTGTGPNTVWLVDVCVDQATDVIRLTVTGPSPAEPDRVAARLSDVFATVWPDALLANAEAAPQDSDLFISPSTVTAAQFRKLEKRFGGLRAVLPLSPLQEGLYFHHLNTQDEERDVYITQTILSLEGSLDPAEVHQSAHLVISAAPTVAAGITSMGDRTVQLIPSEVSFPFSFHDICASVKPQEDAEKIERSAASATFDPGEPPIFRFDLIKVSDGQHRLVFTAHHMLLDGWSIRLLLLLILRGIGHPDFVLNLPPVTRHLDWLAARDLSQARERWSTTLDGLRPSILFPACVGTVPNCDHAEVELLLPHGLVADVMEAARTEHTTFSATAELAWATVLMQLLGTDDVVFGTVISGRTPEIAEVENIIGLLFNTVPVRATGRGRTPLREILSQLHQQRSLHARHGYIGLVDIQRETGYTPLFDTLFVVQNLPSPADDERFGPAGELILSGAEVRDATHYPVMLVLSPRQDGSMAMRLAYRRDVLSGTAADALAIRYLRALQGVVKDLSLPPHSVDLLNETERSRLSEISTLQSVPDMSVIDLLTEQIHRNPRQIAVVAGVVRLSFAELGCQAYRLAHYLISEGVGPEKRVALFLPRTHYMLVGMFAVFAANAAYVPIDIEHPADRVELMLELSAPTVVLVTEDTRSMLPAAWSNLSHVISVDGQQMAYELESMPTDPVSRSANRSETGMDNLAYIIFTSGSTGTPKGVEVSYRGLTNMFVNHRDRIFRPVALRQNNRRLRIAHTTSFSFDASWEQLFWLLDGHEVHVIDDDMRRDPAMLLTYFDDQRIDAFDVTPTYGSFLVEEGLLDRPRSQGISQSGSDAGVVFVSLGGEAVGERLWSRLRAANGVDAYNLYGPTECTINALGCDLAESGTPAIGRPTLNTYSYVLGPGLLAVPPGAVGELYIAGVGLARGYRCSPDLTAQAFVACPDGYGRRMYRTGDLVRLREDGNIDYLGRADRQLKIRGIRIEPSEVESVITEHPRVKQAAVIGLGKSDSASLAAYIVLGGSAADSSVRDGDPDRMVDVISSFLSARLPPAMVPSAWCVLDVLPRTVNGKLDTDALPEASRGASVGEHPRTPLELMIATEFCQLLGCDSVARDADFFELGGHSLLAVRLMTRLRDECGVSLPVREIYSATTPALLAERVSAKDSESTGTGFEPVLTLGKVSAGQLFCLPAAGGLGWSYAALLPYIGEQWCIRCLQDPGLIPEGPMINAFDELVDYYVDLIRKMANTGPYYLLGWSFGGQLATEIACRLHESGEKTALMHIDSVLLNELDTCTASTDADLRSEAGIFLGQPLFENLSANETRRVTQAYIRHSRMMEVSTTSVYPGDVIAISATSDKSESLLSQRNTQWQKVISGNYHSIEVYADHYGVVSSEGWKHTGPIVSDWLMTSAGDSR